MKSWSAKTVPVSNGPADVLDIRWCGRDQFAQDWCVHGRSEVGDVHSAFAGSYSKHYGCTRYYKQEVEQVKQVLEAGHQSLHHHPESKAIDLVEIGLVRA